MELSQESVDGVYKPIDKYVTKLTTKKLALVLTRRKISPVTVNGAVKLGLGDPTGVGCCVLETREVRKLQEAEPSEGIGSFSLDIVLADDVTVDVNDGTSEEHSLQTDIDVEDAEDISAATRS
eukprot:14068278-Ditylum_brightwellii.AAC.1